MKPAGFCPVSHFHHPPHIQQDGSVFGGCWGVSGSGDNYRTPQRPTIYCPPATSDVLADTTAPRTGHRDADRGRCLTSPATRLGHRRVPAGRMNRSTKSQVNGRNSGVAPRAANRVPAATTGHLLRSRGRVRTPLPLPQRRRSCLTIATWITDFYDACRDTQSVTECRSSIAADQMASPRSPRSNKDALTNTVTNAVTHCQIKTLASGFYRWPSTWIDALGLSLLYPG